MTPFTNPVYWCWAGAAIVSAAPILWIRARQSMRARSAPAWEMTTATIQSIEIPVKPHGPTKHVRISYSYFVNEYRSGEHSIFLKEQLAYEVARLLKDVSIEVRYNPGNPDISSLSDEDVLTIAARMFEQERFREGPSFSELQFDKAEFPSKQ